MTSIKKRYSTLQRQIKNNPTAMASKPDTQPLKSGKQNADAIIMKIAKSFKDRSRKDIQSWRLALMAAEHHETPRFNRYYDLVDDLKTDGTLIKNLILRMGATLSVGHQIRSENGEVNEAATKLFNQMWFYTYLKDNIKSFIFGTKVPEFQSFNGKKIKYKLIPSRNTVPTLKRVYPDLSKDDFIPYDTTEQKAWIIEMNGDDPFGLINYIIPNLIWKRNVAQSWAEFCEKFGMPLISATTNNSNTAHIDKVEKQLLALAEASVGVFPEGTTIKFDEANRTDAYNVYSKFIEQNSNEISGVLVGSNTLGSNQANRSNTEVHERSLDFKISQSDRRDIAFGVNDDLLPLLMMQGYSEIKEGDVFEWIESKEEIDLNKFWTIVQGLLQEYDIDEDWISKTFNIPIIGKKKSSVPIIQAKIRNQSIMSFIIPEYSKANCCPSHSQPKAIGLNKRLDDLTQLLLELLWKNEDTLGLEGTMIAEEGLELVKGLKKGFGVTAGWNTPDTLAYQLMEYNLFEFSATKTEARMAAMTELLIDKEKNEIRSFNDFKKLASEKVNDFNSNWLETEYNLSIAVGQNAAQYHRFMAEKDTVTSYVQYQTIGDSKVRDAHARLNGMIFNLSDKSAMNLWPPNGYGCRCEFLQYIGDTKNVSNGKQAIEILDSEDGKFSSSQFNINRGDLGQVFTKKQFYTTTKGLPDKLNQMTYDKYGLQKWDSFKSDLNPLIVDKTITPENVKELFKKVKNEDFMRFKDYSDRKIILKESVFEKHVTDKKYISEKENRHRLFPNIKNIISNPDEVWYNSPDKLENIKFQSRYLKFYQDAVIVIDCETTKNGLEIKTWYQQKKEDQGLRKGLLIRNNKM